ncbi:MAG: hypothetical protein QOD06_741 [Candidatus Binatota bacterium]|nr:hypothetical protein [Candidatus Binatota bacterium]
MPRRKQEPSARPAPPAEIPRATAWIESDSYDRARWDELVRDSPSLRELGEKGAVFLPHFASLLRDLFCALYKHNVLHLADDAVAPSARPNRLLLDGLLSSAPYEHLRATTPLDEGRAGLATALLGERALEFLRSEKVFTRRDLLDTFDVARDEEDLRRRADEIADGREMLDRGDLPEAAKKAVDELVRRLEREAQAVEGKLRRKGTQLSQELSRGAGEAEKRLAIEGLAVAQSFDDATEEAESWGRGLGARGNGSAGQSLELGRRLARNPKLRKLARLLGQMREQALALRHRLLERSTAEVYEVGAGSDLSRLLPQELLALRNPLLRRDWRRRFLEGELLQYRLRGEDERGRGPMVVCLDVSSSMAGDKEIWSKAVALTLLDVARRERRRFRAILFSSADTGLRTFDLNRGEPWTASVGGALDLAEYFPGGGTDFERPLDAAVECLSESRFRKGDVVLITDGECRVADGWRQRFTDEKKRLDFSLYSVLIDVGGNTMETLAQISDRVSRISELRAEGVKELFARL